MREEDTPSEFSEVDVAFGGRGWRPVSAPTGRRDSADSVMKPPPARTRDAIKSGKETEDPPTGPKFGTFQGDGQAANSFPRLPLPRRPETPTKDPSSPAGHGISEVSSSRGGSPANSDPPFYFL
ncbi:uncharacterized protein LOC111637233 [Centruroides sculpturatus]|uniref:uncharacterized protein LOC111637233 n=1 Tax=Centruroides sculpturatus TaxID=218467 RepID=UPI000C6DF2F3|nr:uncharacterized protein LOC111637233 [Centruroides sculpturatus]